MDVLFEELDTALRGGDAGAAFDRVAAVCLEEQNYALLFETRLMRRRWELGLPLIQTGDAFPAEKQGAYEQAMIAAAGEVGRLFLEAGQIDRAWPYFRAIGDPGPVRAAIESLEPQQGTELDAVIEIAFQQGVHPVKGLELILKQYGMCRAITLFGMYGVAAGRSECMRLITTALYEELANNLRQTVEANEGLQPAGSGVAALIEGREWLFGEYDYYVDTSHLSSVVQYATETEDRETLTRIVEMCAYGRCLSDNLLIRGNPPFDNIYEDYGTWAQALLGRDAEAAIGHFRRKVEEAEAGETAAAQTLVQLLVKLGRPGEALEVAVAHLGQVPPAHLSCPAPMQLAHLAGEHGRLRELARERQDALTYIAASLA